VIPPFAVILYVPGDDNSISSQTPTFIAVAKSSYWAVVSSTGDEYLNGTTVYRFTTAVSSATELQPVVNITFSIASFDYLFASQFVDYDWVTLVGQLGGAAALASASHMVIMALFAKMRKYYYRHILGQEIDDEGEEKAELPESIAVVGEGEDANAGAAGAFAKGGSGVIPSAPGSAVYGSLGSFGVIAGGSTVFGKDGKKKIKKRSVKRYSVVVVPHPLRHTMMVPPPPRGQRTGSAAIPPELHDRTPFLGYHYGEDDSSSDDEHKTPADPRRLHK